MPTVTPTVTLKDVAAKAGVSFQTVSKVINGQLQVAPETEGRIWQAIRELNYRPNISARNLRTQASNLIGLAWYATPRTAWHPILNRFLHSIIDAAEAHGYLTTVFTGKGVNAYADTTSYVELYARKQVEGFIVADTVEDDPRIAYLMEHRIPFVSFGRANDGWDFCWVDVDGRHGVESLVKHLIERGHRRIAFITWRWWYRTAQHREEGYLAGLHAAGIPFDSEWLVRGEDSARAGVEAIAHFLSLPVYRRPSAVICVSDQIAIGALHATTAAGFQVGQDIAITGYDDVPVAEYLRPPLTTISQPIYQVGQLVVDLLLKQIHGQPIQQKGILLKPELVIRESS